MQITAIVFLFLRSFFILLLLLLSIFLSGFIQPFPRLKIYQDQPDHYSFRYPKPWRSLPVATGVDVAFADPGSRVDHVSIVISRIDSNPNLLALGSAQEVAQTLLQTTVAPPGSNVEARLITATYRWQQEQAFLDMEFTVRLTSGPSAWRNRHHLISITTHQDHLLSLDASALEAHWPHLAALYAQVIQSFQILG